MTKSTRSSSTIGRANLAKSKAAERAVAAYLRASGWPGAERTVRCGFDVAGRTQPDRGDLDGTPGLCWQIKATHEREHWRVPQWLADTDAQRAAARADLGILVVKRPGQAHPAAWWAYLYVHDFATVLGGRASAAALEHIRLDLRALLPLLQVAGYGTPLQAEDVEVAS